MAKSVNKVLDNHNNKVNAIKENDSSFSSMQEENLKKERLNEYIKNLTPSQKQQMLMEIKYRKARNDFGEYLTLVDDSYKITKFHRFLINVCQSAVERVEKNQKDLINAKKTYICVSVPPQLGKSTTITKSLPSWFVGRNPDLSAILVAYNGDFGENFCDSNRQKTREFGKQVFDISINETQDTKEKYAIDKHKGFVMGRGINAGITGNGCELLIIDDPYKNSNEANSSTYRESVSRVFKDSCLTRLHAGGVCIIIHTRWHESDLIGEQAKEDDTIVINIPLVCDSKNDPLHREIGETLCPELGIGKNFADEIQKRVGLKIFNALYQGHPSIDGGEVFKRDNIKYYTRETLPCRFEEETISCDLSFGGIKKQNDPCAIQVWGRVGANHYLLKRIKKRMTFTEMCEMIKIVSAHYPNAKKKIVEKKANGQAVIDSLNNEIGGFEAYDPKMTDKLGRANAITPYFESGNIHFPCEKIDPTIEEMVDEMLKFPNGAHDDEVDAMTQYLNTWQYRCSGRICTESCYNEIGNAWKGIKI